MNNCQEWSYRNFQNALHFMSRSYIVIITSTSVGRLSWMFDSPYPPTEVRLILWRTGYGIWYTQYALCDAFFALVQVIYIPWPTDFLVQCLLSPVPALHLLFSGLALEYDFRQDLFIQSVWIKCISSGLGGVTACCLHFVMNCNSRTKVVACSVWIYLFYKQWRFIFSDSIVYMTTYPVKAYSTARVPFSFTISSVIHDWWTSSFQKILTLAQVFEHRGSLDPPIPKIY